MLRCLDNSRGCYHKVLMPGAVPSSTTTAWSDPLVRPLAVSGLISFFASGSGLELSMAFGTVWPGFRDSFSHHCLWAGADQAQP